MKRVGMLLVGVAIAPITIGCATGCPGALLTGVLARQGDELIVIENVGGSFPSERVRWPDWHHVEERDGRLVVVDVFGAVKAGEGDAVNLGGGEAGDGTWAVCGLLEVASPAP